MYWFNIFYYDNSPDQFVKPVVDIDGNHLVVFAANPQQATEVAENLMLNSCLYDDHFSKIGVLSSCVVDEDLVRWNADHN